MIALVVVGVFLWFVGWFLPPRLVFMIPTTVDVNLGEQSWEDVAPAAQRCSDPRTLAYLDELSSPLVEAADAEFEFQFALVESTEVNAFALPGGFVTVNMGLIEAAESGEEIAAVLAHELTHATKRHGMRAILRRAGSLVVLGLVFGGTGAETLAYAAEGLATQAHSREQERDADEGGRALLMDAGIDPTGMASFFERLEQEYAVMPDAMRKTVAILSTHPDPGERAATTRELTQGFVASLDLPDPPEELRCHPEDASAP